MKLLFDARTITPSYPGIGRYARGLMTALVDILRDGLTALCHAPDSSLPSTGYRRFTLSTDVRETLDQILTPLTLTRHFTPSRFVYHSPFYIFPYLLPHPTVVTLYDLVPLMHPESFNSTIRTMYALTHCLAASRARHIITLSNAARDDFIHHLHIPPHKISVVPPGILPLATRHQPPVTLPFLLYVGINKPHKNLPRLIEAYARLGPGAPPLLIVGPVDPRFPETQGLVERLNLADRVRFLGHVPEDNLAALYANATFFVSPSLLEGFGFPVLEAMAYGAPVVCSDIPVLRELAGDAALYFDPRQVDSIAQALAEGLANADRRAALQERGLARAQKFTWPAAAQRTIGIYREILAAGSKR